MRLELELEALEGVEGLDMEWEIADGVRWIRGRRMLHCETVVLILKPEQHLS